MFSFQGGAVTIAEEATETPSAKITGDTQAWVGAFLPEPDRDRSGLRIEGDAKLAEVLLDGLTRMAPRARRAVSAA